MRILSFDTSTSTLHLCLADEQKTLVEKNIEPAEENRQEIAAKLIPEIDKILQETSCSKSDLSLVVAGIGPGSFTGIRVGVATARTIAQMLQIPLVGISIFEVLATYLSQSKASKQSLAIILPCTNRECYLATYQVEKSGSFKESIAPHCLPYEELASKIQNINCKLADEKSIRLVAQYINDLEALPKIREVASLQAKIALNKLLLKDHNDKILDRPDTLLEEFAWWKVMPLYLRQPSVTIKKQV